MALHISTQLIPKDFENSRHKNCDEVLKFWAENNLEGSARNFWKYNKKSMDRYM